LHTVNSRRFCICQIAASRGHAEIVLLLLANGANPHRAISPAVHYGFTATVQVLLDHGVNLEKHKRPIAIAARSGQTKMLRFLLDNGASIHGFDRKTGYLGLIRAAESGWVSAIKMLIEEGVNPDGAEGRKSPLLYARESEQSHVVETLIELGASE